jgi:hypothetical protein
MPLRRFGRPGLLATIGRTAVIAGTATMTAQAINRHSQQRAAEQQTFAEQRTTTAAAYPAQPVATRPAAEPDLVGRLSELAELRSSGALTESEFQAAKQQLLA